MVKEGKELAKIHENIVVKVPMIPGGLKATQRLTAGRDQGERNAVLFSNSDVVGCKVWSLVYLSVYRPVRRH